MSTTGTIETGLTFPNVRDGLDPQQLQDFNDWLVSKGISPVVAGDPNPIYNDMFGFQSEGAVIRRGSLMSDIATIAPISNTDWLPKPNTEMFMAAGMEFDGLPLYWNIIDETAFVPEGLPYRTYTDPDGNEQVHTWETWGGFGKHQIYERDGKKLRSTAVNNSIGWLLLTLPFLTNIGLEWYTQSEFIQMGQTVNPAGGEGGRGRGNKNNRS